MKHFRKPSKESDTSLNKWTQKRNETKKFPASKLNVKWAWLFYHWFCFTPDRRVWKLHKFQIILVMGLPASQGAGLRVVIMWRPNEYCTVIWNHVESRALLNAEILLVRARLHVANLIANGLSATSWRRMATSQLRGYAAITSARACWKVWPAGPAYFVISRSLLFFVVFKFFIFLMKWCWTRWWFRLWDITITIVCVYKSKKYTLGRRKRHPCIQVLKNFVK